MQQLSCTSCELQNIDELKDTKVNVPKVLESFTSNYNGSDCNERDTYDEANHLLSRLEKPPEERFDAQHRIYRGDVLQLTWPIKLLHPSKSQVKASDTFYDELLCFFKDMYDMDVYVKPCSI